MRNIFRKYEVVSFFILTFLIGLGISLPLIFSLNDLISVQLPGFLGPLAASSSSLAALILIALNYGKGGFKQLWGKFKFRLNYKWYLLVFLSSMVIMFLGVLMNSWIGKDFPSLGNHLPMLIPMLILVTIQAGVGEEIGWRAFITPKLQKSMNGLKACLLISFIWSIWHVPLYFVPGGFQNVMMHQIGLPVSFVGYTVHLFAASVIMTWSYNLTKSIAMPILIHGFQNGFSWFFSLTEFDTFGYTAILIFTALELLIAISLFQHSGKDLGWTKDCEIG